MCILDGTLSVKNCDVSFELSFAACMSLLAVISAFFRQKIARVLNSFMNSVS